MHRFWFMLLLFIGLAVYFSRWALILPTDVSHLQDRFDHSQWRIPMSKRVISDNELYQIAGIRLLEGANPYSINPEVPPLAKYTYGLTWAATGNPHWLSLGLYLASLALLYLISKELTPNTSLHQVTVILFAISPLLLAQLSQTMLDLPQLVALLLHLWAMLMLRKVANLSFRSPRVLKWIALSGLSLGVAAAMKFPLVIPIFMIADAWLLLKDKRLWWGAPILGIAGLVYLSSYFQYFLLGNNLIDWLKAQKWVYHFYLSSQNEPAPLTFWMTALTGTYVGWWGQTATRVSEWSWWWPAAIVLPIIVGLKQKLRLSPEQQYLSICWLGLLALYTLIPFWPRYFLLLLPLSIFLTLPLLKLLRPQVLYAFIGILLLQTGLFWRPLPSEMLKFASLDWKAGNYQDLATYVDPSFIESVSREKFSQQLKLVETAQGGKPLSVEFQYPDVKPWESEAVVELQLRYPYTQISQPMLIQRIHNRWFLMWDRPASSKQPN